MLAGLRQDLGGGAAEEADALDQEDAALQQEDRAQGHLGGAGAAGGDRVPGEVGRGQGAAPVLQGAAGGFGMTCLVCDDTGWVYAYHPDQPWTGPHPARAMRLTSPTR
jgi:hypothetical protein